jgi:hypothetical protein
MTLLPTNTGVCQWDDLSTPALHLHLLHNYQIAPWAIIPTCLVHEQGLAITNPIDVMNALCDEINWISLMIPTALGH